jgi:hypothetical protein
MLNDYGIVSLSLMCSPHDLVDDKSNLAPNNSKNGSRPNPEDEREGSDV